MHKPNHSTALVNARRACLLLTGYAVGENYSIILTPDHRESIADLLNQFGRLDSKERKQMAGAVSGGSKPKGQSSAVNGRLGGRPKKKEA